MFLRHQKRGDAVEQVEARGDTLFLRHQKRGDSVEQAEARGDTLFLRHQKGEIRRNKRKLEVTHVLMSSLM